MISKATKFTLYKSNSQYVQLTGLFSYSADGNGMLTVKNYESGATVTATLLDVNNAPVEGLNGITLSYVASSQGIYRGQIGSTFDPPVASNYKLKIVASSGGTEMTLLVNTQVVDRSS